MAIFLSEQKIKLLYIGNFSPDEYGQIPDEYLVERGLKENGVEVFTLSFRNFQAILKIIEKEKIDCCLFSLFKAEVEAELLSEVKIKKVMWTFDWMFLERRLPLFLKQGKLMDLVVTTEDVVDWSHFGLNHICIRQGVDASVHKRVPFDKKYANDLVFVGNLYNQKRVDLLRKVANKYQLKVYGHNYFSDLDNGGKVFNDDLCKVYSSSKIALGVNSFIGEGYWSNRVYLALGCGAFFLTPYVEGLEDEFENYKHLVWYKTEDEMFELIDRFLKDERQRKEIASNGYKFVHKNYSYQKRTKKLVEEIKKLGNLGDNLLH